MAVESRRDLASCHGSIVRIAAAHSWSYRSDNPICTRTAEIASQHVENARLFGNHIKEITEQGSPHETGKIVRSGRSIGGRGPEVALFDLIVLPPVVVSRQVDVLPAPIAHIEHTLASTLPIVVASLCSDL